VELTASGRFLVITGASRSQRLQHARVIARARARARLTSPDVYLVDVTRPRTGCDCGIAASFGAADGADYRATDMSCNATGSRNVLPRSGQKRNRTAEVHIAERDIRRSRVRRRKPRLVATRGRNSRDSRESDEDLKT
jgi:hypothetical protein